MPASFPPKFQPNCESQANSLSERVGRYCAAHGTRVMNDLALRGLLAGAGGYLKP